MTLIGSLALFLTCAVAPIPALGQAQEEAEQQQPSATETDEATERGSERFEGRSRFGSAREDQGDDRRGDWREGRGELSGLGDGPAQFFRPLPPFEPPTAEEWEKAMAFIKEHAPKRWALHLQQPESAQQPVREWMFIRFRQLERVRNSDRDIYEIQLRRFALEDEIYSIVSPLFALSGPRSLNPEEVSELREKVAAQVDTVIEERELRLQRLRELLMREEQQLAADKAQRENIVEQRVGFLETGRGIGRMSGGFSPRFGGMGPRHDSGGGSGMHGPR